MKNTKSKLIILVIITLIILFFVLKDDFYDILNILLNSNIKYLLLILFSVVIGDISKSISVSIITKNIQSNFKYINGLTLTLKTNFFNGITPFSLGGQPFQLYSLKKTNDINYVHGADILFEDFYTYQIALMVLSFLFLVLNHFLNLVYINSIASKLLIIGFIINFIIAVILIALPYIVFKEYYIVKFAIYLLYKVKVVNDKKRAFNDFKSKIDTFKIQIINTTKNKVLVFKCVLLNIIKLLSIGLAIYFSLMTVGVNVNVFVCLFITIFITTMASFVPIPGASGGVEYSFILLLSLYVSSDLLKSSLILWRFMTYYLPIIFGGILFMIEDGKNI